MNITNLHPKFQPFLIGSTTCPQKIKDEIDDIFLKPLKPLKSDYIFDAGKWVLKLERTDKILTTPDTHLYRIRKAEKIRSYIYQNNLDAHLAVPKKYLYWNETQQKFYTVAEKMLLSLEVASCQSPYIEESLKNAASQCKGQVEALANNAKKRSLTSIQAKALAELSTLGYTDLTYNNLYFTQDGKVAILDTEPQKRNLNKKVKSNLFFLLFVDRSALLAQQAIAGIAKLKFCINNPDALQAVQKVEKNYALRKMAQIIAKISLITLAIYFTPTITTFIPVAILAKTVKISFIAVAVLKDAILIGNIADIYYLWNLSSKGDDASLFKINQLEKSGII